jgi:hypothetical protein
LQPNGENVTFYELFHDKQTSFLADIQFVMEGCTINCLTPTASAREMFPQIPKQWHEELLHQNGSLNAVIDSGGTFHAINTREYFIDGTIRKSTITTMFNSNSSYAQCDDSGEVETCFGRIRMHHQPTARRSILSEGQLKAIGVRTRDTETHTEYTLNGKVVFSHKLPKPLTRAEVDRDNYVGQLIEVPDKMFFRPARTLPETRPFSHEELTHETLQPVPRGKHETLHSSKIDLIRRENILDLHARLGHIDIRRCAYMLGITLKDKDAVAIRCVFCDIGKIHSAPQGTPLHPATQPLARVQFDSKGPLIASYREGYRWQHTVVCCFLHYADVFYTKDRGEGLSRLQSWCIRANTIFKDRGYRTIDLFIDGAPENKSNALNEFTKSMHISLHIGAPHRHHHQHTVEGTHKILHQCQRASRAAGGLPSKFWKYAHTLAYCARMLVPTSKTLASHMASSKTRPKTPWELWHNNDKSSSFADLHRYLFPFGCEVIAFVPKETRLTDADHGVRAVYLCPAYPNQGSLVLFLDTAEVRAVHTLRAHVNVFPFLIELRKRVPHALKFAPTTVEE